MNDEIEMTTIEQENRDPVQYAPAVFPGYQFVDGMLVPTETQE